MSKQLIEVKKPLDIARQFFPEYPPSILDAIIWGCTGFPEFWPDSSKTPIENFRLQLQNAKERGWETVINEG